MKAERGRLRELGSRARRAKDDRPPEAQSADTQSADAQSADTRPPVETSVGAPAEPQLNRTQQAAFFHTFGALKVPGLFAPEIDSIIAGFEDVFRDHPAQAVDPRASLHKTMDPTEAPRRLITPDFCEQSPKLAWLVDDARVTALVASLLGDDYAYLDSTGNLFNSYIYWHSDYFRSSVPSETNIKLAFYLEDLDGTNGALRVIPGTNHLGPFRSSIFDEDRKQQPGCLDEQYGLPEDDLPCWAIAVRPGDVVVFDDSILHANFNGGSRRRMFSLHFGQAARTNS